MVLAPSKSLEFDLFDRRDGGPGQGAFVDDDAPYSAAVAGIGSGKTRGGGVKALLYCMEHPGALGMVTAPTYPMLRDATLKTLQEVIPPSLAELLRGDMVLKFRNGSEILLRSTDDPDRLRGPNLAFVWMDEAAQSSGDAFKVLQGRLRQHGYPHQLWVTTTPQGYNWLYQEFARETREDYRLFTWSTRDNPYLPPAFVRQLEESYADEFALQEIDGEFVIVGSRAYFQAEAIRKMYQQARDPLEERLGGALKIWGKPGVAERYVAFADCAWGETMAYDCLSVYSYNAHSAEKVAELHGRLSDDEMALETFKLCTLFNNAYLGVEANGEGINVVNKLIDLGYGPHMYHRGDDWKTNPKHRGWQTDVSTRPVMLGEYEEAVRLRRVADYCRESVAEHGAFIRNEKGRAEHSEGSYDDHVMSAAGAWQMRHHARFGSSPDAGVLTVDRGY